MSFACQILASFLLMLSFSTTGEAPGNITVYGILDQDINLDISDSQMNEDFGDIQWEKDGARIARRKNNQTDLQKDKYQLFNNATLKIKHLKRNDSSNYKAKIYSETGKHIIEKTFDLKIVEAVSKPVISWSCTNTTLTCEVKKGTDYKLRLYRNRINIKEDHKIIVYKWKNVNELYNCIASNEANEENDTVTITCSGKVDIYLIVGICAAGITFFIFVALLIVYISKRKKQHRRRDGEELDIRVHRITSEERTQKPHQIPGSAPQNPAVSQPPPPPGHRTQAPGHRPPPPGHRVQHQQQQQQKRPLPPHGTQGHQQKGPPLPRPRVQPKPPRGFTENS
ncbi:T-cell surface antigen CD2 [Hipposideros larvatus]